MLSDEKRANLNALAKRELYAELPREDPVYSEGQCIVGRLRLALYANRNAAQLWHECLAQHLVELGFARGASNPFVYHHSFRGVRVLVHGDDFVSTGSLEELRWMKGQLESGFDVKTTIAGLAQDSDVVPEGKILNRFIRAFRSGWEYECEQRHAEEVLVEELGLLGNKPLTTPGSDEVVGDETSPELDGPTATQYRAMVARCNYIADDRADAQDCVKEFCRDIDVSTQASWARLQRLGRYYLVRPRTII